jgi:trk system potassium uptake protein TrkH
VMQVDRLPYSLLFFRSYSQWAGGFGIIVLSLLILTGPGRNAFQLYLSEFGERNLEGSVRLMAREVGFIYLVITTTGYLAYAAAGMGWSDALLNILSTVSTGGFSGHADSFGYYKSPAVQIVAIPFMIMGALSFTTFLRTVNRDSGALLRDRQLQLLLALILLYFGLGLAFRASRSVGPLALLFRAASEVTTTGFSIAGYTGPTQDLRLLDLLLMVTGGSSGSTAGGIKLFRLILMVKTIRFWILSVLFPEEVRLPIRVGDQIIHERELRMAFAFVGVFALLLSFTAVTLALAGFAPVEALYEAASALGTVGTSSGITSPALAPELKLLLVVNMWAGRLEILPLLLLFYPRLWIERRRSP